MFLRTICLCQHLVVLSRSVQAVQLPHGAVEQIRRSKPILLNASVHVFFHRCKRHPPPFKETRASA